MLGVRYAVHTALSRDEIWAWGTRSVATRTALVRPNSGPHSKLTDGKYIYIYTWASEPARHTHLEKNL